MTASAPARAWAAITGRAAGELSRRSRWRKAATRISEDQEASGGRGQGGEVVGPGRYDGEAVRVPGAVGGHGAGLDVHGNVQAAEGGAKLGDVIAVDQGVGV